MTSVTVPEKKERGLSKKNCKEDLKYAMLETTYETLCCHKADQHAHLHSSEILASALHKMAHILVPSLILNY
jgi:hypothetical protein